MFLLFTASPGLVYAGHKEPTNIQQNPQITPIPLPANPDIQPIPKPEGEPEIQQAQVGGIICGALKLAVFKQADPCGAVGGAVKAAFTAFMDFIYFLLAGVNFGDTARLNEKMDAYKRGVDDPSQIPYAGALDYAGFIAGEALQLNVPVSSSQYFASINPFAQVHAQEGARQLAGTGVILEIWQRVRNAAYALSAVVLMLVGFMIMLRWRLDPRTVVTIQNSLPRIVIALILITFSFAISGFMIDITRLVTAVIMSLVEVPGGAILGLVGLIIGLIVGGAALTVSPVPLVGPALLLIGLILLIIIFVVFLVLIYKLLTRYVIFLLLTIFAPFFFLAGALPGGEGLVLNWFKRQAAALLGIPMTALFVNLSFKIGFSGLSVAGGFPSPWPMTGPLSSILLFPPLIGFALFFFATKVPDIVDEMFGIKEMGARKGIGPGAIIGAPLGAFQGAGNLGRAWRGTKGIRGAIGNVAGARGWGGATVIVPEPTGNITTRVAQSPGFGAKIARGVAKLTGSGQSDREGEVVRKEWLGDYQRRVGREKRDQGSGPIPRGVPQEEDEEN